MARQSLAATANPAGVATVTFGPPAGFYWRIEQINVSSTSALASTAIVAVNGHNGPASSAGNQDTADGHPFIIMQSPDEMTVTWEGCSPAAECIAEIYYSVQARGPGQPIPQP